MHAAAFYVDYENQRFYWYVPNSTANKQVLGVYVAGGGPGTTVSLPPDVAAELDGFLAGDMTSGVLLDHFATLWRAGSGWPDDAPVPQGEAAKEVIASAFVVPAWRMMERYLEERKTQRNRGERK